MLASTQPANRFSTYPGSAHFEMSGQIVMIGGMLSHPDVFPIANPILEEYFFDDQLHSTYRFIRGHHETYGCLPSHKLIEQATALIIPELSTGSVHRQWLLDELERFARYKAHEIAILDGVELLQSGQFAEFHRRVEAANGIRLNDIEAPFASLWGDQTDTVQPPTYLIKPWLVEDTITCVFGAPGSFKSFWCLEAALCFASGTPFAGRPVKRTSVAYVAAEGQGGIALRVEAWQEQRRVKLRHTDLLLITQPVNLMDDSNVSLFIRYLKDVETRHGIRFGVVFLDTYSQCIAGADENSAAVASQACGSMIRMRRELGATVVFVHHTGKDIGRGMRGSDALRGNSDGAIEIERVDGATSLSAVAKVVRHKDAPIGGSVPFTMEIANLARLAGLDLAGSLVCTFPTNEGEAKPSPMSQMLDQKLRLAILNIMPQGNTKSMGKVAKLVGMHDSAHYKAKIAAVLPINEIVEVTDKLGKPLGTLRRFFDPTRADQTWGSVVCEQKTPKPIQQAELLPSLITR